MHAASAIERILSEGDKKTTYKLAVLRAVVDYVIDAPCQDSHNGLHLIPIVELARRALMYYWRPTLEGISQGENPQQKIPSIVRELHRAQSNVSIRQVDLGSPSAGMALGLGMLHSEKIPDPVLGALRHVRRTLLEQPVQYIRNLRRGQVDLFSFITVTGERSYVHILDSYNQHRKRASGMGRLLKGPTWAHLLQQEQAYLVLSSRSYEELANFRFWLRDAIILRWIKECQRFLGIEAKKRKSGKEDDNLPRSDIVASLELTLPERDTAAISQVKALYSSLGFNKCFYTGRKLGGDWELDHALPFSRFPVDLFWNLLPSSVAANRGTGGKSDSVPKLTLEFNGAYERFLDRCLASGESLIIRDLEASYRGYFQSDVPPDFADTQRTVRELGALFANNHRSLVEAGVHEWEPTRAQYTA